VEKAATRNPRRFDALQFAQFAAWLTLAIVFYPVSPVFAAIVAAGTPFILRRMLYPHLAQRDDLAIAFLVPFSFALMGAVNKAVRELTPHTIDAQLSMLDMGFGRAVWTFAKAHAWFLQPITVIYFALPEAMLFAAFLAKSERGRLLVSLALGAVLVIPCYLLFPAVGPAHVGDPLAPRDCMPSMHLAWALLLWMNARGRIRPVFAIFAGLTAVATLATGEHYLPDLVAAVPWAWALNRLANIISTTNLKKMLKGKHA
jgi:hypothetical protein